MKVLVACEFSGTVREAFRARGHEAISCDLLPDDQGSPHHIQEYIEDLLKHNDQWDLMLAFPPCTHEELRREWILTNTPWFSKFTLPPDGWDGIKQLEDAELLPPSPILIPKESD